VGEPRKVHQRKWLGVDEASPKEGLGLHEWEKKTHGEKTDKQFKGNKMD